MDIKNFYFSFPFCCLIFLTIASCKKDVDPIDPPAPPTQENEIAYNVPGFDETIHPMIQTSIGGIVTDQSSNAISGAVVNLEGYTQTTDDNGVFYFKDVNIKERAYLTTDVAGYFLGSKALWTLANSSNFTEIQLMQETIVGSFSESAGGVVTMPNNSSVKFPASAIVKADGSGYSGQVNVAMAYLDPEASELPKYMPGNLDASSTDGSNVLLETFGMLALELLGSAGEPLQLKKGNTAEITVPLSAAVLTDAPGEIPLWFFDEQWGYWREEGKATLQGNNYVGQVGHFSFWSGGALVPLVQMKGTLKDPMGNNLQGYYIVLTRNIMSQLPTGAGITDNNGSFSGSIPANETFVIEVEDCGMVIYTATIGPFATNTILPNIVVPVPNNSIITGTLVDCGGTPVINGYAKIEFGGRSHIRIVSGGGAFSFSFSNCSGATSFDLQGFDIANCNKSVSSSHTIAPAVNVGNVSVCTPSTYYLTYSLNGGNNTTIKGYLVAERYFDMVTGLPFINLIAENTPTGTDIFVMVIEGDSVGTFPVTKGVNIVAASTLSPLGHIAGSGMTCTITRFDQIGGDVRGSFTGTIADSTGSMQQSLSGNFNVHRVF